jgi:hypothetical protein
MNLQPELDIERPLGNIPTPPFVYLLTYSNLSMLSGPSTSTAPEPAAVISVSEHDL